MPTKCGISGYHLCESPGSTARRPDVLSGASCTERNRPSPAKSSRSRSSGEDGLVPEPPQGPEDFPVVGIGASAGGLGACTKLLGALPSDISSSCNFVARIGELRASPSSESDLCGSWPGLRDPKAYHGGNSGDAVPHGRTSPPFLTPDVCHALQGQCRSPPPHSEAAASGYELVRI